MQTPHVVMLIVCYIMYNMHAAQPSCPTGRTAQRQLRCHYACPALAVILQCAVMPYIGSQLIQGVTQDCTYLTQQEDMK